MQGNETASQFGACCQIVDIRIGGSRAAGSRRNGRLDTLDRRFKGLSLKDRLNIVHSVIGYCRAMSDGIKDGREPREDEISRIVRMIEESINEA